MSQVALHLAHRDLLHSARAVPGLESQMRKVTYEDLKTNAEQGGNNPYAYQRSNQEGPKTRQVVPRYEWF